MTDIIKSTSGLDMVASLADVLRLADTLSQARGGFIPFCDHRCPPNVNPADYLYYLDLKEKLFGLHG